MNVVVLYSIIFKNRKEEKVFFMLYWGNELCVILKFVFSKWEGEYIDCFRLIISYFWNILLINI